MNLFLAKLLTLDSLLHIAADSCLEARRRVQVLRCAVQSAIDLGAQSCLVQITRNMSWRAIYPIAKIVAENVKRGKNEQQIYDATCLAVINEYDTIFVAISKLDKNKGINFEIKLKEKPCHITRLLMIFDDLTELSVSNKRFSFFYFFKVHEIISLIGQVKNEQNIILTQFYELLHVLGDLNEYNQLFTSNITFDSLNILTSLFDIPRDIVKLIIIYCQLSIHDGKDLDNISTKLSTKIRIF